MLRSKGPVIVEVVVDTNAPPMPPKVRAGQAFHFAEALARGTSGAAEIVQSVVEEQTRELV